MTLTSHVRLHQLLVAVLARLVDYTGLWERDLYFITLAKIYREGAKPKEVFKSKGLGKLTNGQITSALQELKADRPLIGDKALFNDQVLPNGQDKETHKKLRNNFAHFEMLRHPGSIDLTAEINKARNLMAYDRKLKNAISVSVIELLHREGIKICWAMNDAHELGSPKISGRSIKHLKGRGGYEDLQGKDFLFFVAQLFKGEVVDGHTGDRKGGDKRRPATRRFRSQKRPNRQRR